MVVALKVTVNLRKKKSAFQIRQLLSDIDNNNLNTIFIFEFSHYLEKKKPSRRFCLSGKGVKTFVKTN